MDEGDLIVRMNLMLSGSQRNEPLEKSLKRIKEFPMIIGY